MALHQAHATFAAGALVAALAATWAPAVAESDAGAGSRLCRVLYDETTNGSDVLTQHAETDITTVTPDPDGGMVMLGAGQSSVTYKTASGCAVIGGGSFTSRVQVIVSSDDGQTADVDFVLPDRPHSITTGCGATFDVIVDAPPSVNVPLKDGGSAPYAESGGRGIHRGSLEGRVTFQFCKP